MVQAREAQATALAREAQGKSTAQVESVASYRAGQARQVAQGKSAAQACEARRKTMAQARTVADRRVGQARQVAWRTGRLGAVQQWTRQPAGEAQLAGRLGAVQHWTRARPVQKKHPKNQD